MPAPMPEMPSGRVFVRGGFSCPVLRRRGGVPCRLSFSWIVCFLSYVRIEPAELDGLDAGLRDALGVAGMGVF